MIILEKFQNKKQLNVLTSRKLKFNVVINMIYYCWEKKSHIDQISSIQTVKRFYCIFSSLKYHTLYS